MNASSIGQGFHTDSRATEPRWPVFAPRAHAMGINAIVSSPLLVRDRPVGALNIYSRTASAFSDQDQDLASLFAGEASRVLGGAESSPGSPDVSIWLAEAVETRQIIALAQGVLMERDNIDRPEAYRALRRSSTQSGRPLRERATELVISAHPPTLDASTMSENFYG